MLGLAIPLAFAGSFGSLNFGKGLYSFGEVIPEAAAAPSSGGGGVSSSGGGGGGPPPVPIVTDFTIDKSTLKVVLRQGQTKEEKFTIKNIGNSIFDVKTNLEGIGSFKAYPKENEIITTLQPNESKTIEILYKALENSKPDIYPGRIKLSAPSVKKDLISIIEVDSAEPLFDVDVAVLPKSKKVFPGDEVLMEVNLFNVRGFGRVDVIVEYAIKDLDGNVISSEHETVAVETQAKFTRSILVPSNSLPGAYAAFVKVTYGDSIGVSSDLFEIEAKSIQFYQIPKDYRIYLLFGGIFILIASLLIYGYNKGYFKRKTIESEKKETKQLKGEAKSEKLKKELKSLEEAHSSGFISDESYNNNKKRLEDELNKTRK